MFIPERTELDRLEDVLGRIAEAPRFSGARGMLYNIASELISNGVRANLKRVFFKGHGYDPGDPESYKMGLRQFLGNYKTIYRDNFYRRALREDNLDIRLEADLNPDRLILSIYNRTPLFLHEERRIRNKLARAMGSDYSFSATTSVFEEETEGRDLGFGIIIESIRRMGFDPALFRIYSCEGETRARLEFPLRVSYIPIRHRRESSPECLPA